MLHVGESAPQCSESEGQVSVLAYGRERVHQLHRVASVLCLVLVLAFALDCLLSVKFCNPVHMTHLDTFFL